MNARPNNKYEVPFAHYAERYAALDPEETAGRCGVAYDAAAGCFALRLMGKPLSLAWPAFTVRTGTLEGPARILLMRYLLEGRLLPSAGRFLSYREMPWGEVYDRNFQGRCIRRLARSFSPAAFDAGMRRLNARKVGGADHAYEFSFLEGLAMRFLLWEGDDEFPPSAQILFSDNFPFAFSAEDLAVVGDVSIGILGDAANKPS